MKLFKSIFGKKSLPTEKVIVAQIGEMTKYNRFWSITLNDVDLTFDYSGESIPNKSIEIWLSIKDQIDLLVEQSLDYLNKNADAPRLVKEQFNGITIVPEYEDEDFRIDFEIEESFTFYTAIYKNKSIIDYDSGD